MPRSLASLCLAYRLCFRIATKFAGLIEGFHSTPLRIGSCDYVSLLAAEGISHSEYQKRTLFSVNAISKYLKSIRRFLRDASLGKQLKGYLFARSEEVNAKSFIFSFTQSLLILFVSEYKYIISTLKPFVKKNFKSFSLTPLGVGT